LSTRTFPVLSADEDSTAVIGDAPQVRFSVALLKTTALDPKPVPVAESRTFTGPKTRMEFWARIAGTTRVEHTAIAP
jgi:hypothetical protein